MSQKKTIFVTVLGGVAEVDTTTVPEGVEVEIVDFDALDEPETDYLKLLSVKARCRYVAPLSSCAPDSMKQSAFSD
jgi:hypothetical protein